MRARTGAVAVLLALAACTNHRAAAVPPTVSASPSPPVASSPAAPALPLAPLPAIGPAPAPAKGASRRVRKPPPTPTDRRPPQFVVVSFDGAGNTALFEHWRAVAAAKAAHFTFFLSGTYLVPIGERTRYHGPHHRAGRSDIAFFTPEHVALLREQLASAYAEGHEIGTHFNGHFCAGRPGNVGTWTTADWTAEIAQFDEFLTAARLPFGTAEVVGGRTPCLQGRPDQLFPALQARHFRYDASLTGYLGRWPVRRQGLWEFPLQSIPVVGTSRSELSMDYNMYALQSHAVDGPASEVAADTQQTLATYENAFDQVYAGNRAPLFLGNHFELWNGGAYTAALTSFVTDECGKPAVRCVSFRELADWLDAQPAADLARLQRR